MRLMRTLGARRNPSSHLRWCLRGWVPWKRRREARCSLGWAPKQAEVAEKFWVLKGKLSHVHKVGSSLRTVGEPGTSPHIRSRVDYEKATPSELQDNPLNE